LKVLIPTDNAISHPVILPSLSKDFLQLINFLQVVISPDYNAHYKEPKNASSPRLSIGCDLTF